MKCGDIIFVRDDSFLSRAIRSVDKGPFSHVALAISPYHVIEAQYFKGVKVSDITELSYTYGEEIDIGLSREQRRLVLDKAMQYIGRPYDYEQVASYLFRNLLRLQARCIINHPHQLICSELIEDVLIDIKALDGAYAKGKTPNELYRFLIQHFPSVQMEMW